MASLIPGYEYDIFISYRQKDNKGDRWVSEFVEALKSEMESTFKEEVSIYFDINPHDGLLETHEVSDSLREKLKCLVFIPIISRTYCDPKSFAWEHEFIAFIEQASKDQYGLKVKIPNGNIASRILPVRIHDLDAEDIKLCESALGSVLRGVEFIYKSAGVNRPLRSMEEKPLENLNKTIYRDQLNKVANAIKEIVAGLSAGTNLPGKGEEESRMPWEKEGKEKKTIQEKPKGFLTGRMRSYVISAVIVLVMLGIYAYPKIFRRDTLERMRSSGERISVAVMPFQNMTNDTTWDYWQNGLQDLLIGSLSNHSGELQIFSKEKITDLLKGKGITSYASLTPSLASTYARNLDASVFISGSINQAGGKVRIGAQLINPRTEETFKSFEIYASSNGADLFKINDSIYALVKNFLIISKLEKGISRDLKPYTTSSAEAYKNFLLASNAPDMPSQIKYYSLAIKADSNYIPAMIFLSMRYQWQSLYDDAKKWCLKAYEKRDQVSDTYRIMAEWHYAALFESPKEAIECLRPYLLLDDQLPAVYEQMGYAYSSLLQYENAISEYLKALEICKKWQVKSFTLISLGDAYHKTGQYRKAKEVYKKAEKDFPDNDVLIFNQAVLSLSEGDTAKANRYILKYRSIAKGSSRSEAAIASALAGIYGEAGMFDKVEEYYRLALSLEPENTSRLRILAFFLIDKERNINEGMELVEKYIKLRSETYQIMDIKGWGLYKQGKYKEALDVLQKSWDLRLKKAVYDHQAFLHLEAAKKAVAGMK